MPCAPSSQARLAVALLWLIAAWVVFIQCTRVCLSACVTGMDSSDVDDR